MDGDVFSTDHGHATPVCASEVAVVPPLHRPATGTLNTVVTQRRRFVEDDVVPNPRTLGPARMVDRICIRMMNVVADDAQIASRWILGITVPSEDARGTRATDFDARDFETLHRIEHDLVRFRTRQAFFRIGAET